MRLLLDTHVLLWFAAGDAQLGRLARHANANPANEVLVSVVSLWEAAIKVRTAELEADVPGPVTGGVRAGFGWLEVKPEHVQALMWQPMREGHRDPFDYLLLAQAAAEGAMFVTDDGSAQGYGVAVMRVG